MNIDQLNDISSPQNISLQKKDSKSPFMQGEKFLEHVQQAAKDFEGVTISELLKPMFDTVDESKNYFGGGEAEQQFRSLQVTELGKQIANNGGIGLAESVYKKMLEMQEKASHNV